MQRRKVGRVESSPEIVPPSRPSRTLCDRRPTVGFRSRQQLGSRERHSEIQYRQVTSPSLTPACN
jgi:hypothetical protein